MVDFTSFKWLLICIYHLLSLFIDIIIARVFAEYSHLEVLGMEGMIIIGLVILEKCKGKVDQKYSV